MLTLISLIYKEQYLNIIILKELVLEITTILIFSVIYMKLKPLLITIQLLKVIAKGLIGFHFQNYDQGALGQEESHLVHTRTSSFALFALESF